MQTFKTIKRIPRSISKQISFKPTIQTRTMAFFPGRTAFYGGNEPGFAPLFRLLDDFDSYNRQTGTGTGHHRRGGIPHFQPKFDVRETDTAFELHGELAGMKKEDVHVEFTDPQTVLIRGRIERSYTAGTPPAGLLEDEPAAPAITESEHAHRVTVEDEEASTSQPTPAASTTEVEKKTEEKKTEEKKPADKFWVSERSIGEFSRSFNFPTRIDQDGVVANLKDGVLSVTVPKAKKHESRRIAIN
jgi:HSP20 family molecular chaperone IbpA